jgi:hypothetical protein
VKYHPYRTGVLTEARDPGPEHCQAGTPKGEWRLERRLGTLNFSEATGRETDRTVRATELNGRSNFERAEGQSAGVERAGQER